MPNLPRIFNTPLPDMDQDPYGGIPQTDPAAQMANSAVPQPPVASPAEMALANLFRQQMAAPEDDEIKRLRDREDAIYERIMKGPRARSKEIAADLWKEQYGITEKSGKLARIFAGLGELGRSVGSSGKRPSIADQARELATKEYQTEVGPLQREASVLSSAQKAVKAQADLNEYRNEQLQIQHFLAQMKNARSEAEIANIRAMTPVKVQEAAARTGLLNVQAANQKATGGMSGIFGAANALGSKPEVDQKSFLRSIFGIKSAEAAAELEYDPKNFSPLRLTAPRSSSSTRPVLQGIGPGNLPQFRDITTTTVSQGAPKPVFDPTAANDAVNRFKQSLGIFSQVAEDAAPKTLRTPTGEVVEMRPTGRQPATSVTQVGGKTTNMVKWDPRLQGVMTTYFPDLDVTHPESIPEAYRGISHTGLAKPLTKEENADRLAIEGGKKLAKNIVTQYLKNDLSGVVGPLGAKAGWLSRAQGKATTGQVVIDTAAKEGLSNYVRAMSGMATSRAELKRYEDIKANSGDQETTFTQKALTAMIAGAQTEWMSGLNLPEAIRDKLMEDPSLLMAPIYKADDAIKHLDAARVAQRNGSPTYTIPGDTTAYPTRLADKIVWNMITGVNREMQDAYIRLMPDGGKFGPSAKAIVKKTPQK